MDKLFVIKIGGNIIDDEEKLIIISSKILHQLKRNKILVHGGGKIATEIGRQTWTFESKYIDGRRITDAETLRLVTMVYGGLDQ